VADLADSLSAPAPNSIEAVFYQRRVLIDVRLEGSDIVVFSVREGALNPSFERRIRTLATQYPDRHLIIEFAPYDTNGIPMATASSDGRIALQLRKKRGRVVVVAGVAAPHLLPNDMVAESVEAAASMIRKQADEDGRKAASSAGLGT
jgi:hypothetical protein